MSPLIDYVILGGIMEGISLLHPRPKSPVKLRLIRNLTRSIKRGHPWIFADALRQRPAAPPGAQAILLDNKKGREIARGFYDASSPLAFRVCTVEPGQSLDDHWAEKRLSRAVALRQALFGQDTTGFRLLNGEGDGLPGLICDIYGDTAVIQLDGAGPRGFWHSQGIARWLTQTLSIQSVYERPQSRRSAQSQGQILAGEITASAVPFLENGVHFRADIIKGQKTGFFLDQRDNRQRVRQLAGDRRVLNLFGYTGGFSVYAGLGGARQTTTVDLAGPALTAAEHHWQLNKLPAANHQAVAADVFEFLKKATKQKKRWELVIADPPSFAPSKETASKALPAYQQLITASAAVTGPEGILAAASCSSHISQELFLEVCETGIAQARRHATLLGVYGQPPDHPTPLAFPEFRYLKFVLMRVE